jgi:osmotically inducible protein OsmC
MPTRNASATWSGGLKGGKGHFESKSGAIQGPYSFPTRFENHPGTNPEELLASAHAACYAMAFSALLEQRGYTPEKIDADAAVTLGETDGKPTIVKSELVVQGSVPGLDDDTFRTIAEEAKSFCPVSRALGGLEVELKEVELTG